MDAIVDGAVTDLGGPRPRRLLLALALRPGRVLSEAELIDAVWGDGELPNSPDNTLQQYVSRFRALLGPHVIETEAPGYRLSPAVTLDVDAFEAEVGRARALESRGDITAARATLDGALSLWRGPAFGGLGDLAMAEAESLRLGELHNSALLLDAELLLQDGSVDAARARAEQLGAEQPLREGPVALAARAMRAGGSIAEAVRSIHEFRVRLADETGLEISPELAALEQQLLSNEPVDTLGPSRRLRGYELAEMIGEGAFGSIYRATQPSVGREVAIKVVRPELADDPRFIRRFEVEAQTVARLEHPHIVPLFDYWREPGGAYLVMRYLRGGSAENRLIAEGPLQLSDVGRVVDEIGGALAVAHAAGIVHRDVKPANILFDENGNSYLADFGIAVAGGSGSDLELTSAGSPLYVSPEQIRDGQSSQSSDIYALGVVIYELLTATTPYPNVSSIDELFELKVHGRPAAAADLRPDLPASIDQVILRATDPSPDDRFADVGELVLAFRSASGGLPASAVTTGHDATERPRAQASQTLVSVELQNANPYKGLAAFHESDAADFFGRDALTEQLVDQLEDSRFLVVVGPSGSGKSSAVRAGLVPRLRGDDTYVCQMMPGQRPMHELETALLRIAVDPLPTLLEQLQSDRHGLSRGIQRCLPETGGELVLVVDQFEELFTLAASNDREAFLAALHAVATDPRSRAKIVITIRADFYDRPLSHPLISELVQANSVAVTPLTSLELERAITGPAERLGVSVDPALVAELIGQATTSPGVLPLMQFVLTETFERRSGSQMTLAAYRELGGVDGAIARRAEEIHDALDASADARRLFTRLISPGEGTEDTRRRVLMTELTEVADEVIDAYGGARLLSFDRDPESREPTVEVAHEALIREWPRLRGWIDEDRDGLRVQRHLGDAAAAWAAGGRDAGELYRGGRLEAAEEHAHHRQDDLNELERDFLGASVVQRADEEAREQRSRRRLRNLLAGVAIIAAMALIASVVAFQQRGEANDQRAVAESQAELAQQQTDVAEEQTRRAEEQTELAEGSLALAQEAEARALDTAYRAETGRLVAEAKSLAATNPRVAMLLAVAAYDRQATHEAQGALLAAMMDTDSLVGHVRWGQPYLDVEWLADDRVLAIAADRLELIDLGTGELLDELPWSLERTPSPFNAVSGVADAAPDGSRVVVTDDAGRVTLFDTTDGLAVVWDVVLTEPAYSVSLGSGEAGPLVAAADLNNLLTVISSDGVIVGSIDVEDADNIADQTGDLIDLRFLADFYAGVPVLPTVKVLDDAVMIASGSILRLVDRAATEVTQSTLMRNDHAEGSPGFAQQILDLDGGRVVLLGFSTAHLFDPSGPWDDQLVLPPLEGVRGGATQTPIHGAAVGESLFLGLIDGTVARFAADGSRVENIAPGLGPIRSTDVNPVGGSMAIAHDNGVSLLSFDHSSPLTEAIPRPAEATVLSTSRDGRYAAAGPRGLPGPMSVGDLNSGSADVSPVFDVDPTWATFVLDTDLFVVSFVDQDTNEDGELHFSFADDATVSRGRYETDAGGGSSFTMSSELGLTAYARTTGPRIVEIYPFGGFTPIRVLEDPADDDDLLITSARFDEARGRLFIGSENGAFDLYDVDSWDRIELPALVDADLAAVQWSLDGSLVAAASSDGTVTIRDGETFEVIRTMVGALGLTNTFGEGSLLLSGDNRFLLTNLDETAQLWDVEAGQQIGPAIPTFPGTLTGANRDQEGLRLATGTERALLSWNLDVESWRDIACRAAGSNLTSDEWTQWGPRDEEFRAICSQYTR